MIRKNERSCSSTAFAAVDCDEIDSSLGFSHLRCEFSPEALFTDCGFDPHRQSCCVGQRFDEIQHAVHVAKCCVSRWTDAVLTQRDSSDRSNLRRDFNCRQNAAKPGLGALTEFYLDGAYRARSDRFQKPFHGKTAVRVSTTEV